MIHICVWFSISRSTMRIGVMTRLQRKVLVVLFGVQRVKALKSLCACELLMNNLSYFLEQGNMTEELVFLNEYNKICMSKRTLGCDYSLCTCEIKEFILSDWILDTFSI